MTIQEELMLIEAQLVELERLAKDFSNSFMESSERKVRRRIRELSALKVGLEARLNS